MLGKRAILAFLVSTALLSANPASAAELIISAASSLTNAFKELAKRYETEQVQSTILLNFAASDVLLQQILQGAPADVFASADQKVMDKAVDGHAVVADSRMDFAQNELVLIVPAASKLAINSLQDLKEAAIERIAFGNPASVPVGRYTQGALQVAGVWDAVSAKGVLAQNVRQSLDYVARGEVDAGFVFATDAALMPDSVRVALRVPTVTPVSYPIAITSRTANLLEAERFLAYVRSPQGQEILARYGFKSP